MSLLNITKVSDTAEQCWGVELLDDNGATLLRSEKGVRKGEITSIAKALKFEGAGAALVIPGAGKPDGPAWILEKAEQGWHVRFTPVEITGFDLILKPEDAAGSPTAAEEAMKAVKNCLTHAELHWDPPEADPAYQEKVIEETKIAGIPGSGPQISAAMQEKLNDFAMWKLVQVPVLEEPVLVILDYSPSMEQLPLSIAFDYGRGPKCWMTASRVRKIGDDAPKYHEDYREFPWKGRQFMPYSIQKLPESIRLTAMKSAATSRHSTSSNSGSSSSGAS